MAAAKKQREATADEFKAMANPLRLRILRLCLHEPRTNQEIAQLLAKDPATTLHHVRLLVRTGFLAAQPPRTGARGALEKPYLATRKSWVLKVSRPEDQTTELLAVVDAVRAELADAGPGATIAGARIGLCLDDGRAAELADRLEAIVAEYANGPEDPGGTHYGLFVNLHRLRP